MFSRWNGYAENRRLDTLKSIAGFLNAKGGTLFIGVTEDTDPPSVRGIDEDLKFAGGSKDALQRVLRDLITTRIGSEFSPSITDRLEEANGKLYWVVVVEESPVPAFVRWHPVGEKEQRKFYVREGPKTSDLDNESTWHYIKNKWG
jgi:predicted HTH transcriptional regulator